MDYEWAEPEAKFLITWRCACWPMTNIDVTDKARELYCKTQEEVDAWKEEYRKWASLEGNKVEFSVWNSDFKLLESRWF